MMTTSALVVFACTFMSIAMFVDFVRSRRRLFSRIAALAPGSSISERAPIAKRLRRLTKREAEQVDFELTELVDILVAALLAGESLFLAIRRVTDVSTGFVSRQFSILLQRVELGGEVTEELGALCERVPTDAIREFTNKLSLALARGTPLSTSLLALSSSLRARRAASLLRRAGANETKMLIPVVLLICPVTVIFALYPSSQFLAAGFI